MKRDDQTGGADINLAREQEKREARDGLPLALFTSKLVEHLAWNRVHNPVDQMLG